MGKVRIYSQLTYYDLQCGYLTNNYCNYPWSGMQQAIGLWVKIVCLDWLSNQWLSTWPSLKTAQKTGYTRIQKLFPFYHLETLKKNRIRTVSQLIKTHLSGRIDKSISPKLLMSLAPYPALQHKLRIFMQAILQQQYHSKYSSPQTILATLVKLKPILVAVQAKMPWTVRQFHRSRRWYCHLPKSMCIH